MTKPVPAEGTPEATATDGRPHGLCGMRVTVDGETLLVEDTVLHAVVARKISDEFLDHGSDTYWCVNSEGRHRIVRASEVSSAG